MVDIYSFDQLRTSIEFGSNWFSQYYLHIFSLDPPVKLLNWGIIHLWMFDLILGMNKNISLSHEEDTWQMKYNRI